MPLFTILRNILKNRKLKEYQPVSLVQYNFPQYYLLHNEQETECRIFHILYDPVMILAVCKNEFTVNQNMPFELISTAGFETDKNIKSTLKFRQHISAKEHDVLLFEVLHVELSLNLIENWYLKRIYAYSQKRKANFIADFNYNQYKKLVALFAQPKKVYLITINAGEQSHSFPIDLCAMHNNRFYIGIRNSNKNANRLALNDEFYVSSAAISDYEHIYNLGKFSSAKRFDKNTTDLIMDTSVPNLICDYARVKLTEKIKLDYQSIYIAEIISSKNLSTGKKPLYHLHKLWFLQLKNNTQFVSF